MDARIAIAVAAGVLFLSGFFLLRKPKSTAPLPPGPKGLPLVGNLFNLPGNGQLLWRCWAELKHPVASLTVFGTTLIILNDLLATFELLEKRSNIYSGRPRVIFALEMVGWDRFTAFIPFPDALKRHRRAIHSTIGTKATLSQYTQRLELEVSRFLRDVLINPSKVVRHVRRETGAIILGITYGYDVKVEGSDALVDLADQALAELTIAATPGAWLVDAVPTLRWIPDWFPGASFKQVAARLRSTLDDLSEKPFEMVKQQMAAGTAKPSFVSKQYTSKLTKHEEDETKWIAASLYAAGADTTVAALSTFFLAISLHPEVQRKAHAELDRVIGKYRLPILADRDKLPYIDAIIKETHRWRPVAPTGVPHAALQDDIYDGYLIPKGAQMIPNVSLFASDQTAYPVPESFNPDRFMTTPAPPDPTAFTFGFGRRVCAGRLLAESSMFLTIAQSLAAFEFGKAMDENGKEVEPSVEYGPGFVSHPPPFGVTAKVRSREMERLIVAVE